MILQIRATSGGGKTTAARYLYERANCAPKVFEGKKPLINRGDWNGHEFFMIGPYDKPGTGGCDRISKIEQVVGLVDRCAKRSPEAIVVFEGLLLAHSWGQMGEFIHAKYGRRYVNAFIDTSVVQCLANVITRRGIAGADNTDAARIAKITKNVYDDYHRVELAYSRVVKRGGLRIDVPYLTSGPDLEAYITAWCEVRDTFF